MHLALFSQSMFQILTEYFSSLPKEKTLDCSKLKAFADNKINEAEKMVICFGKDKKHCEKRRKCWLPAFSPFLTMFSTDFLYGVVNSLQDNKSSALTKLEN